MSDDLRLIVHDLRGSLGSIRLAVTGLLESDDDAEFRREMLQLADREIQHAAAGLAGVHALLSAGDARDVVAVADVIDEAVRLASSAGVAVATDDLDRTTRAECGPNAALALAALLQLCGSDGGPVSVAVVAVDGRAALSIVGEGGRPLAPRLVEELSRSAFASVAVMDGSTVRIDLIGGE